MRIVFPATLVACSIVGLQLAGCAADEDPGDDGSTSNDDGSGGDGSGGAAGSGGGGGSCEAETEICDGLDNDCDEDVDEDCDCTAGDTQVCYSGRPARTAGVGECKAGTQTCDTSGAWGACDGEVIPGAEECNGKDDDCNGSVDELGETTCGVGACQVTVVACEGGTVNRCTPLPAGLEICDGIDNNCDQQTDESFPQQNAVCDTGVPGICAAGTVQCVAGAETCVAAMTGMPETCDSLDNDCNGTIDDNIPGTGGACSTGDDGVCSTGIVSCQGGLIDCFSVVSASPEVCDGLDNDCDGSTDEGNPEGGGACDTGLLGICQPGTVNCIGGALSCVQNASVGNELCDGLDNDCDGTVDDGNPGAGAPCGGGGVTTCVGGTLSCLIEAVCNDGLDDDGDGLVDCADPTCALGCSGTPCAAGQLLVVRTSSDIPKNIADNSTIASLLPMPNMGTVQRVRLQINITHTYDGDLDISLSSPTGPALLDVTSDNGGTGENYTNTIFDSTCVTSIVSGTSPYSGCYQPEASFTAFNGTPANGTWTLTVTDDAGSDTGTLSAYRLALCIQPP